MSVIYWRSVATVIGAALVLVGGYLAMVHGAGHDTYTSLGIASGVVGISVIGLGWIHLGRKQ